MFDAIHSLHKLGFVHRDIKTENFRVHDGKLYLIDFGIVIENKDIKQDVNLPLNGTPTYCSHWTHEGYNQEFRDDLEMLGYTILELLLEDQKERYWFNSQLG